VGGNRNLWSLRAVSGGYNVTFANNDSIVFTRSLAVLAALGADPGVEGGYVVLVAHAVLRSDGSIVAAM
jgi:hypothetical protein